MLGGWRPAGSGLEDLEGVASYPELQVVRITGNSVASLKTLGKLKHLVSQLIDALASHPESDALLLGHLHTVSALVDDVAAQPHYDIVGDVLQFGGSLSEDMISFKLQG